MAEPMDEARLKVIEVVLGAITTGAWRLEFLKDVLPDDDISYATRLRVATDHQVICWGIGGIEVEDTDMRTWLGFSDIRFIVEAPKMVRELLDEVTRLKEEAGNNGT